MFNQSHQQGQHGRVNGGTGGRGMPNMMYNFQHQNQQQAHHPSLQQDSNAHPTNGLGHHSSYSSGVLSNATPSFTPTGLQNGHSGLTRGGEAQSISKHWADQLKLHQESQSAHRSMLENHAPHHFARIKAGENRGIAQSVSTGAGPPPDAESENHGRTSNRPDFIKRQDWNNLDLSGLGLKVVAPTLFHYDFLNELYIASNKLTQLPASIGQLRHLTLLDASNNQLSQLPPELGMCVFLVNLLFFDNNVHTIPNELGSLYKLEMLGIEGNPFDPEMKKQIMEHGTKSLILKLREETPGKSRNLSLRCNTN
jgi:CCR4-NOT transcription complex subunit 6